MNTYKRTLKPQKLLNAQEWTNFHRSLQDHSNNQMPRTSTPLPNNLRHERAPDTCKILEEENMKYYLDLVEHKFWDKPEIYHEFLNIIQEYNSGHIDKLSVASRAYDLFKKYPDLIVMYNNIHLPCFKRKMQPDGQGHIPQKFNKVFDSMTKHYTMSPQHDTTINLECKSDSSNFQINNNDTIKFIKLLQHQFSDEPKIYHEFLNILHKYEMRRMSIQTVNTRLSDLFKKYPNIIAKFNSLSQTRSKPKVQPSKKVVEPGSMLTHRVTSWQNHTNSLQQEVCATLQKLTQDSTNFLDLVQQQYRDRPEVYNKFIDIMREYVSKPKNDCQPVITRICNLFKESPYIILNFKKYLPPDYDIEIQMEPGRYVYQVQSPTSNSHVIHTGTLLQPNNNNMTTIESSRLDSSFKSSPSVQSTKTSHAIYEQNNNDYTLIVGDSSHRLSVHNPLLSSGSTYTSHNSNAQTQTVNQPLKRKVGVLTRAMRRKALV